MLSWILNGVEYSLDDGEHCLLIGTDGLGMAPMHRIDERGPLQHGTTDRGYRLDSRIIVLGLQVFGNTQAELWQKREELIALFKPRNTAGILKWTVGGLTREILAHAVDGLSFSAKDRSGWSQKTAVSLKCDDPTWFDPTAKAATVTVSVGGDSGGTIPMDVPTGVADSGINVTFEVNYEGNVDSFPHLIRLTGPLTSPILTNLVTGEKLDFSGTTIAAGDYYEIDLRYGYKTVKDAAGANKNSKLTADSDLSLFRLVAHPDAADGINTIQVTGSGETAATRVDFTYYDRFLGI